MRNSRLSLVDRALRLICAFAVALVTTFHVCDATSANVVELVSLSMKTDDDAGKSPSSGLAAVEKCHTCAVASLAVSVPAEPGVAVVRDVPAGTILHVSTFQQPTVGPPPRA
ncbi:MAG: hypothetical protein J0J01_05825 [Reyranella sp.]|uniref:hypothetical protein n=1 Tax=Reyranella sp. TaxID=1929291 RepID=UPI001ACC5931|nr:hypothetical protein [Reyranella sp.]MBN9086407.1 hypothetical protein [Reyranella sp.]